MMMAKAREEARKEPEIEPEKPDYETTTRGSYTKYDMSGVKVGARVMKTQDGKPVKRDPVFLAESKIVDRHRADLVVGRVFDTGAPPDHAVTIYSRNNTKK